jgi:hypothetical protein
VSIVVFSASHRWVHGCRPAEDLSIETDGRSPRAGRATFLQKSQRQHLEESKESVPCSPSRAISSTQKESKSSIGQGYSLLVSSPLHGSWCLYGLPFGSAHQVQYLFKYKRENLQNTRRIYRHRQNFYRPLRNGTCPFCSWLTCCGEGKDDNKIVRDISRHERRWASSASQPRSCSSSLCQSSGIHTSLECHKVGTHVCTTFHRTAGKGTY